MTNPLVASKISTLEGQKLLTLDEFITQGCELMKQLIRTEIVC